MELANRDSEWLQKLGVTTEVSPNVGSPGLLIGDCLETLPPDSAVFGSSHRRIWIRHLKYGQAYVALSGAIDLEGLCIRDFSGNTVKVHKDVLEFYTLVETELKRQQAEARVV
jgi:hypothetical protein